MATDAAVHAVLFDLDATLLDTERILDDIIAGYMKSQFGASVPQALLDSLRGATDMGPGSWTAVMIEHFGLSGRVTDVQLHAAVYGLFAAQMSECDPMPGAYDAVQSLSARGLRMAIVTSSKQDAVQQKRTRHEEAIFKHMETIVTVEDVEPRAKPAPDCYLLAATRLGVSPARCIVVEDSLPGIKAGVAAGMRVLAVPAAHVREAARVCGAHAILESLHELIDHPLLA